MAVFFLFVGLEIKREVLDGQLETWARRILPGAAALGGMAAPAVVFMLLNWNDPATIRGWAIPAATDIAFALAVLTLLGNRIPVSLRIFLTALAIIDDLGAVAIIAFFYTSNVSFLYLGLAVTITALLANMNRIGIVRLWPYLFLGAVLWFCVFRSGIHATVAGVVLAFTIPLHATRGHPDLTTSSPLHRLEHGLQKWVAFLIIPIFGFANAGVSVAGLTTEILSNRLALGIVLGLSLGKLVGVFGSVLFVTSIGFAGLPAGSTRLQVFGISLLCGIGFTMSLFIGALSFPNDHGLQNTVKVAILVGSVVAGSFGWIVLRWAPKRPSTSFGNAQTGDSPR